MKQMSERRPQGWSRNPSQFSYRARAAAIAAMSAMVCIVLVGDNPKLILEVPLFFVASGFLSLCGPTDRWRALPWLGALNALIAFVCLLASFHFGVLWPAIEGVTSPLGWILACMSAINAGLTCDEWLASAQTLRRLSQRGRNVTRVFFGVSPL